MLLDLVSNGGERLGMPLFVVGAPFVYEFDLPASATWVRAELYAPDLDAERAAVCDGLVGEQSTLCRNRLGDHGADLGDLSAAVTAGSLRSRPTIGG